MKASVIIPTFKRPGMAFKLAQQIRSLYPNIEIIIVDQENPKPKVSYLQVKYFNLPKANTSSAKNKGTEESSGDIIIFFDDDTEITADTIKAHIDAYKDNNVVATAGRVLNDDDRIPKETNVETGKTNFLGTKFLYQFWSTKKQYVDFPYGCNMSFRKSLLKKVGGFDKRFPKIFEEVDLGRRVSKIGKIRFSPNALVYHHKAPVGGIRPDEKLNKQKLIFRNYGYYLAKNVVFPLSLLSLLLRTRTALMKSLFVIKDLYQGYFDYVLTLRNIVIFFAFGAIIYLRLYKVPQFFSFNFDEEYQASLAWEQVKHFHKIWIGVSASNLKYYLGPGFTYLNAFLFYLSHGDPISLAYFSVFWGIITLLSIFYVAKNLFSEKAAIFASIIYGVSSFLNFFDRRFWNPLPMPFISVWMIYSLAKAEKDTRWFILTAILIAASFHVNLGLMIFWPLIIFVLIKKLRQIKLTTWLLMVASYSIVTFPLLVFDLVHNFDNMKAPFRFFLERNEPNRNITFTTISTHISAFLSSLGRIWFLKPYTNIQEEQNLGAHGFMTAGNPLMIIFSTLILFYVGYKSIKNNNISYRLLFFSILLFFLSFALYPGYAAEYYLLGFFALFTIAAGIFLEKLPKQLVYIFLTGFIIFNFWTILTSTQEQYGLAARKKLIQQVMKNVDDQPFALETYGKDPRKYHPYGGWRYLFKVYGKTPTQSFADEFFGWIYKNELTHIRPTLKVVISEDIPYNMSKKPLIETKVGAFYGYVFKID